MPREALLLAQWILIFCFLSFLFIYVNCLFSVSQKKKYTLNLVYIVYPCNVHVLTCLMITCVALK